MLSDGVSHAYARVFLRLDMPLALGAAATGAPAAPTQTTTAPPKLAVHATEEQPL